MAMGKYFLYPDVPDYGGAVVRGVGLLNAARNARDKQRLEEDDAGRRWANLDRQNRLVDLQAEQMRGAAERQAKTQHRQDALDFEKITEAINRKLVQNSPDYDPAGAERLAGAFGIKGFQQEKAPEPVQPQAPPELTDNVDYMLRQPYEGSRTGGAPVTAEPGTAIEGRPDLEGLIGRALSEGRANQTERAHEDLGRQSAGREYLAAQEKYKADLAALPGQREQEQRYPTYGGTSEFGPVRFDPMRREDALNARSNEEAARIEAMAETATDPYLKSELASVAAGARARQFPKEGDAVKQANFLYQQRMGMEKFLKAQELIEGRSKRAAQAQLSGRGEMAADRAVNQTDRRQGMLLQKFKDWKATAAIPSNLKDFKLAEDGLRNITAKNSVQQRTAIFSVGKRINGAGVFSNQDAQQILGNTGGTVQQLMDFMQKVQTGEYDDATVARFADALQSQITVIKERTRSAIASFEDEFEKDPYLADLQASVKSYKNATFGLFGRKAEDLPEQPAVITRPGRPAGKLGGGARRSLKVTGGPNDSAGDVVKRLLELDAATK